MKRVRWRFCLRLLQLPPPPPPPLPLLLLLPPPAACATAAAAAWQLPDHRVPLEDACWKKIKLWFVVKVFMDQREVSIRSKGTFSIKELIIFVIKNVVNSKLFYQSEFNNCLYLIPWLFLFNFFSEKCGSPVNVSVVAEILVMLVKVMM